MRESNEIPHDWENVKLSDVCDKITDGSHFSPKSVDIGFPYVTVKDLKNDTIDFSKCLKISKKDYDNLSRNDCNPLRNDVLFSKDGTVGKVALINFDLQFVVLSSLAILRPLSNIILSEYLFYILKSSHFLLQALNQKKGVAIRRIILRDLKEINLNLPPLPEQHRIVAKIEELFSSLDTGIESLKTAQQQLKVYRQAVLKWAFEGRLTNKNVAEGQLPEAWKWKQIKEITAVLGDGLHGTPSYSEAGEYYFINGNNLSDGKIEIKANTKCVTIEEYEKYKKPLNEKTIFVSINGTLGNTAFYNGEKIILGKSACYFNVQNTVDKQYVRYCITSQRFLNYAHKNATGSTIKNVGLKAMREFEIPLPPTIEEQHAIVAEIESRLSVCDKIEESIEQSLRQSESLRQSILKKAFEGKLVPQNPNDEPASKLLERIKAQKEKTASKKRR